jgi:hypothetical protein
MNCLSAHFPRRAFTASDVLDLSLHRGSFETVLADEDVEQNADRWYSHTQCGQEFAQILAQWVWNFRLELGQKLSPEDARTTEFAKALVVEQPLPVKPSLTVEPVPSEKKPCKLSTALRNSLVLRLPKASLGLCLPCNPMECCAVLPTILCIPRNGVPPRNGSLRVLYAARIGHCRSCPLRAQCQESSTTLKPRRVSAVLWPLDASRSDGSPSQGKAPQELPLAPLLWRDWPRCGIRRTWLKVVRSQTVRLESSIPANPSPSPAQISPTLTRSKRAHWRLSWEERFARNARPSDAPRLVVTLHGLPATFARSFGFDLLDTA